MTDAPLVKIIGISINDDSKPWDNGDELIAFFDCDVRGFRFCGCLLIRTTKGGFVVALPRIENQRGDKRAAKITDTH